MATTSPIVEIMVDVISNESTGLLAIQAAGEVIGADAAFNFRTAEAHGRDGSSTASDLMGKIAKYEAIVEHASSAWSRFKDEIVATGALHAEPHEALERVLREVRHALEAIDSSATTHSSSTTSWGDPQGRVASGGGRRRHRIETFADYRDAIAELESFWEPDDGVFWRLRHGQFVEADVMAFVQYLDGLEVPEDAILPRRLVSLLWYVPLVMQWQADRVLEAGGDRVAHSRTITAVTNELERLLGVP